MALKEENKKLHNHMPWLCMDMLLNNLWFNNLLQSSCHNNYYTACIQWQASTHCGLRVRMLFTVTISTELFVDPEMNVVILQIAHVYVLGLPQCHTLNFGLTFTLLPIHSYKVSCILHVVWKLKFT